MTKENEEKVKDIIRSQLVGFPEKIINDYFISLNESQKKEYLRGFLSDFDAIKED